MERSPPVEERKRTRGPYNRVTIACRHCRRRKIRCLGAPDDAQGRCSNCIRLKKECHWYGNESTASPLTAEPDPEALIALRAALVGQDRERSTDSTVNSKKRSHTGQERGRSPVRNRATSPDHYSENERTRSQSPAHSFYHGDSPSRKASPIGSEFYASHSRATSFSSKAIELSDVLFPTYPTRPPELSPRLSIDESDTDVPGEAFSGPKHTTGNVAYEYTPLCDDEIRLLRITPGLFHSPLQCSLKIVSMEKITTIVHEFQALSYAWGNDSPSCNLLLSDLPKAGDGSSTAPTQPRTYPIRLNLFQALKHIRLVDEYIWLWVDYLCIEQTNQEEKSQQIPKMPSIYSSAWNVIAWLGVDDTPGDVEEAVCLIPEILNLKKLDIDLRGEPNIKDLSCYHSWIAFGHILQRPWFRRRWVIQEVACARRLSVRIADKILSWLDFADAVDLYSDHLEQMRARHRNSAFYEEQFSPFDVICISEAVELMRFSRIVFQRSLESTIASRLMTLETLVLTASSFAVSEVRDTVYALLYLANDMHDVIDTSSGSGNQHVLTSDYSKHPVDIFKDFVRYSIAKSNSLDVLCRQWASWPQLNVVYGYEKRFLPSWIGLASFRADRISHFYRNPVENLLGPVGSPVYHASQGVVFQGQAIPSMIDDIIQLDGMLLGTVDTISTFALHKGFLTNDSLRMLGWRGTLNEGIDDQLWRTLVANRNPNSKVAPTWYRRACALALTQLDGSGDLDSETLLADGSQPGTLIEYLKCVQAAAAYQRIFRFKSLGLLAGPMPVQNKTQEAIVGLGPTYMKPGDETLVCILYGSSVPVILSVMDKPKVQGDNTLHVKLVGPCYVHGHMEGEIFAGMSEKEIQSRTTKFSIH
jgi:hypothetical protein